MYCMADIHFNLTLGFTELFDSIYKITEAERDRGPGAVLQSNQVSWNNSAVWSGLKWPTLDLGTVLCTGFTREACLAVLIPFNYSFREPSLELWSLSKSSQDDSLAQGQVFKTSQRCWLIHCRVEWKKNFPKTYFWKVQVIWKNSSCE